MGNKDWKNDDSGFERFHTDRGVKKKQKRGDGRRDHQRLKEIATNPNLYDEAFEDDDEYPKSKR